MEGTEDFPVGAVVVEAVGSQLEMVVTVETAAGVMWW